MANVVASKTVIVMGRETTYGTAFTTPTVKLPDMMDYTFGEEQVIVPQKTQTLAPMIKTSQLGRIKPTVTLKGIWTDSHEEMFVACFGDTATAYVIGTTDLAPNAAGYSYTIVQAVPASSSDLGDGVQATGCRLVSLTLAKEGEYIGYTAVFDAKTIDDMVSLGDYTLTGITNTTYPELTPMLFRQVTAELHDTGTASNLLSFNLTITNEYASDDICFQNSQTRISQPKCGTTAILSVDVLYDTVFDAVVYDGLFNQTTYTDEIVLTDGTNTHTITTEGQYTAYSKPDKEKCLFTSSFTKELTGTASVVPISIATA